MRPSESRDPIAGPDSGPSPPFPIRLSGPVIKGFGRGSKELGIPTANIPPEGLSAYPSLDVGVYYGVVALDPSTSTSAGTQAILPAVLSIGYNPFYKNQERSVEIHILPPLSAPSATVTEEQQQQEKAETKQQGKVVKFNKLPDFYGTKLNLLMLGYIRPEYDYVSLEALIEDIRVDCEVARGSLLRPAYAVYLSGEGEGSEEVKREKQWLRSF